MSTLRVDDLPSIPETQNDSVDTWLSLLVRLLDVSASQRDAIRDEIEGHLRERVRDLMISGKPETDAVRTAINELGEVADLAKRFSHASKSRTRRTIMNAAVLVFGGISVATATVFISSPQPDTTGVAIFNPPATATADETSLLDDRIADAPFEDETLGNVLKFLSALAGLDLVVHTNDLERSGISTEEGITLQLNDKPISQILGHVSGQLESPLAWRVTKGVLEVATTDTFDRREVVLASYEVHSVLDLIWESTNSLDEASERLEALMIEYVEPDAWYANGGDLANLRIVGGKMFVKAPARFHEPIQWILGQLEESAMANAAAPTLPGGLGRGYGGSMGAPTRALPPGVTGAGAPSAFEPTGPAPVGGRSRSLFSTPGADFGGPTPPGGITGGGAGSRAKPPGAPAASPLDPAKPATPEPEGEGGGRTDSGDR